MDLVDVFTSIPFAGNALAVVHGAEQLSTAAMQAIARELNLSETAFPLPPAQPGADYRLRAFSPLVELPFAGHPSVGTAWVLARDGVLGHGTVTQECGAGLLPVTVDEHGARLTGGTPQLGADLDAAVLAAALGLRPADPAIAAGIAGCGLDFNYFLADPAELPAAAARPDQVLAAVVGRGIVPVAWDPATRTATVRMFRGTGGEDPATGSAALGLGVWLVARGLLPADGHAEYLVRQGEWLGRPSELHCTVTATGGRATEVTVWGGVVEVGAGRIRIPG
ncbi:MULTISPECIES: PhzF family phenazine biosynthesis protein [unclassified Crossiella]|uniref:PhzF family phenazine biosynthesis protein n=1 Tax=unclassified Crossiella TaxID=2620835 RepID=UPI00200008C8|nr:MULTISPECIES: PhzF family phenazine biosynthesis protein [unclassified Crossiella]MCK2237229.1 PhzF family phenazine biosynthesis protein [Crossiella sp. S99.2]MCK2250884.1 PhzF family phenazine biosynthesis protein [Crossiella sp. S99.1]